MSLSEYHVLMSEGPNAAGLTQILDSRGGAGTLRKEDATAQQKSTHLLSRAYCAVHSGPPRPHATVVSVDTTALVTAYNMHRNTVDTDVIYALRRE